MVFECIDVPSLKHFSIETLDKLSCFLSFKYEEAAVREHFLDLKLRKQNAVACLKRMRAVQFDRIQSTPLVYRST